MRLRHPPIALLSFNRPDYLRQVLASLLAQPDIAQREIFLFQDGDRHEDSNVAYAKPEQIKACIGLFREAFPRGHVLAARSNLGVAENMLRAERLFFEDLGADCGYFFEDDLVLSPRYLATLDRMREAAGASGEVGYFACYGNLQADAETQRRDAAILRPMAQLWGFGLFRDHWEAMQPELVEYYDFVCGRDYRRRPHAEILKLYRDRGVLVGASSQDDVKKALTYALGRVALNTTLVHARYIGEVGLHSNPDQYRSSGVDRTVMLDLDQPGIILPDAAGFEAIRTAEADWRRRKIGKEASKPAPEPAQKLPRVGLPSMPQEDRALFERVVAGRRRYAEFGTGGSTPLALRLGIETLVAVEADPAWAEAVRQTPEVSAAVAEGRATVLHADIGAIADWGTPVDKEPSRLWPRYVSFMWREWARRASFPDVVLVDGRFRVACCLSVALLHAARRGEAPPLVMLRDLTPQRPSYQAVFHAFREVERTHTLCVLAPREDVAPEALLASLVERVLELA